MRDKISIKRVLLLILKMAVSLVFICFVVRRIDLSLLKGYLKGADISYLALAVITLVAGGFAGAASWLPVLKSNGYNSAYRSVCAMHWCGMFFNSFLPSNIGGDFYKGYLLVKGSGGGATKAAVTILLDRMINFSVLVLIGVLSFCISFGWAKTAVCAVAGFICVVLLIRFLALKSGDTSGNRVVEFVFLLIRFFRDYRNCAIAFAAALLSQGLKISCHVFLIKAMGLDLELSSVWYIIPLFGVISALPVSLGGIGIREYAAIGIAGPLAVAQEELVALSLVSHLLFIGVNCLGFIPFVVMRNAVKPPACAMHAGRQSK